ncbi:MAG: NAD+ synthase [Rikenellaceae bacterium]
MNVAVCQLNFSVGDLALNTQKIIEQIEIHKTNGVELVIFPELAISGTPLYDLVAEPNFTDRCYAVLSDIADVTKGISVLVGLPTNGGDEIFNSVAYIKNGNVEEIFSKGALSSRDETPYFAGLESLYFDDNEDLDDDTLPINKIKVGNQIAAVVIGEDINFILDSDDDNYDFIIQIAARSYMHGIIEEDLEFVGAVAKECGVPVITCNAVGAATDVVFYGASAMFNPKGQRVLKMTNFEEDVQVVSTSPKEVLAYKSIKLSPSTPSSKVRHDYKAISLGLKDYFEKSGLKTVTLGLSGGIDSAVVLAVAADTLGAENIRCYLMPSQFSSDHSVNDAKAMAETLGIQFDKVCIEPMYSQFMTTIKDVTGDTEFGLAEENLQARIRAMILMYMSNKNGSIVLNTTNKSEAAMGYGTLYGDSVGALSILGDLYKTEVYALAEYINRNGEIIPFSIINKAPSAELRPGQKDSDSLPDYDTLDKILYCVIEEPLSEMEIAVEGFNMETIALVKSRLKQNEHKRHQVGPAIRVSKRVLGVDRVIPIVYK